MRALSISFLPIYCPTSVCAAMPIPIIGMKAKCIQRTTMLTPAHVAFVQSAVSEQEGEFVFELIHETDTEQFAGYFFVMAHGYEEESSFTPTRVH